MTTAIIDCGKSLGMDDIDDMYADLLSLLAEDKQVSFDCSKIERIDTAALQMLCAFARESDIHGFTIVWDKTSDIFVHNARLIGLAGIMGLTNSRNDDGL